jgi:hypothetical protein
LAYPSFEWSPAFARKALPLAALSLCACAIGLVAGAPASLLTTPAIADAAGSLHGSVWRGAAVRPDGTVMSWETVLVDSLLAGRLSGRWTLDQPGASLAGEFRAGQSANLSDISGRVTTEAMRSFFADMPPDCTGIFDIRDARIRLGADKFLVAGEVIASSLECANEDLPDLKATATLAGDVNTVQVVTLAAGEVFAEGEVFPDGRLSVRLLPAGAAFLSPGSPGKSVSFEAELLPIG